jgi:hypothetical protein
VVVFLLKDRRESALFGDIGVKGITKGNANNPDLGVRKGACVS